VLLFAYSVRDPAGKGIAKALTSILGLELRSGGAGELVEYVKERDFALAGFDAEPTNLDSIGAYFPSIDFVIVLSRHSSAAGVPSLTVHHTGNFGSEAPYGGRPFELGIANPPVAKAMLKSLAALAPEGFEVSYEATHHGPTSLSAPLTFVEIGSTEEEWTRRDLHEIVARAALQALEIRRGDLKTSCRPCIGVGGGHYPKKHTALSLETDLCYGHIISKRVVSLLSPEEFERALEMCASRCKPRPVALVVEKKSVRSSYRKLASSWAARVGLEYLEV